MYRLTIALLICWVTPAATAQTPTYTPTALIIGADKEIGIKFVNVYANRGWQVIATGAEADTSPELQALAANSPLVRVEKLDVTDFAAIDALANKYSDTPIDLLLYATRLTVSEPPSTLESQKFGQLNYDIFYLSLTMNAVASIKVAEAFNNHVVSSRHKKVVQITSMNGSIGKAKIRCQRCGNFFTESSFAAANALMRRLFKFHRSRETGVVVGMIAPGPVNTRDMQPLLADNFPVSSLVSVEESIAGMVKIVDGLNSENSGSFYKYDGQILPW